MIIYRLLILRKNELDDNWSTVTDELYLNLEKVTERFEIDLEDNRIGFKSSSGIVNEGKFEDIYHDYIKASMLWKEKSKYQYQYLILEEYVEE